MSDATTSTRLDGRVAWVTGATRGVGAGIAIALAEAGAQVYATGRTFSAADEAAPRAFGSGRVQPIGCDHTDDAATERAFERILAAEARLDVLVNSAWGGYERMVEDGRFTWPAPFWDQPLWRWDAMFDGGLRAAFACSRLAARVMHTQRAGMIVNLSYWSAQKYLGNVIYGVAKCATDRLTRDIARELSDSQVTVISLYPGLVRTEAVLAAGLDLANSESPQFCGRAVAHLFNLPGRQTLSGSVVVAAALADELGFTDIDGRRPRPLTLDEA
jgi:dehydrogenase/reductase SDR family member 1